MESLDYWRLCEELTISQAAHLLIGMQPGEVEAHERNGSEMYPNSRVRYLTNLEAAQSAISNALRSGSVAGHYISNFNHDVEEATTIIANSTNFDQSIVNVGSLKKWLISRGFRTGFFFPNQSDQPDYLDPNNPRYAPKLAAAVRAWLSVTDPGSKTPKQALTKWLRENAANFGLADDDGKPNETGIEETAKVANWKPEGGAAKTPGS